MTCRRAATLFAWALYIAGPAGAQQIDVTPGDDVVIGTPLHIVIGGFAPAASVLVTARRAVTGTGGRRQRFASWARFTAGPDGRIDLAVDAPLQGSYADADASGLFWSMVPADSSDPLPAVDAGASAGQVDIEATTEANDASGPRSAHRQLTLRPAAAALAWRDAAPLPGSRLARMPGEGRLPALIVVGGSEGGVPARWAGLLASHGPWAALALAYYSPPRFAADGQPLPREVEALPAAFAEIPLERIEEARAWLATQADIDSSRICLVGASKGAELALLAASHDPWLRCVVALAASDIVWEGWGPNVQKDEHSSFAWQGRALPYVPYEGFAEELAGLGRGAAVVLRRPHDAGRAAHPDRAQAARIPVERFAGAMLVAGGRADALWNSGAMAAAIDATRRRAGLPTVALIFEDAGHALGGTGWAPTTTYDTGPFKLGGTPAANAHAQARTFAATLRLLEQAFAVPAAGSRP